MPRWLGSLATDDLLGPDFSFYRARLKAIPIGCSSWEMIYILTTAKKSGLAGVLCGVAGRLVRRKKVRALLLHGLAQRAAGPKSRALHGHVPMVWNQRGAHPLPIGFLQPKLKSFNICSLLHVVKSLISCLVCFGHQQPIFTTALTAISSWVTLCYVSERRITSPATKKTLFDVECYKLLLWWVHWGVTLICFGHQ